MHSRKTPAFNGLTVWSRRRVLDDEPSDYHLGEPCDEGTQPGPTVPESDSWTWSFGGTDLRTNCDAVEIANTAAPPEPRLSRRLFLNVEGLRSLHVDPILLIEIKPGRQQITRVSCRLRPAIDPEHSGTYLVPRPARVVVAVRRPTNPELEFTLDVPSKLSASHNLSSMTADEFESWAIRVSVVPV